MPARMYHPAETAGDGYEIDRALLAADARGLRRGLRYGIPPALLMWATGIYVLLAVLS